MPESKGAHAPGPSGSNGPEPLLATWPAANHRRIVTIVVKTVASACRGIEIVGFIGQSHLLQELFPTDESR